MKILNQNDIDTLLDYEAPNVIALCGLARSGKDTVADYLVNNYGYTRVAYADAIKDMLCDIFKISNEELNDFKNDEASWLAVYDTLTSTSYEMDSYTDLNVTFRNIIENFGQVMKTRFGESVWSDLLISKIMSQGIKKVVISDLRFIIEHEGLKEAFRDLHIFKVNRGLIPMSDHPAENEHVHIGTNLHLDNTKDLSYLYTQIDKYLEERKIIKEAK